MSATQFSIPSTPPSHPTRRVVTLETSLAVLLAITIALIFWTQQRYPALLKKLHSGSGVKVAGTISFDALLKVTPQMPVTEQVARTSVNWLYTNRFGMYFAIPFGASLMTLMAGTAPKRFNSTVGNILCGAVSVVPLGVCTNCATPVAQSLIVGGASTRMTLAAMISSPSFNPVVVAMALVLFPLHLALWRIAVPVALLALLPLLAAENKRKVLSVAMLEEQRGVGARVAAFFGRYGKNLLRLTLMTLPWTVLGATMAVVIPAYGTHLPVTALGVVAVAIVGILLPVPMALDVALAFVLYRAGAQRRTWWRCSAHWAGERLLAQRSVADDWQEDGNSVGRCSGGSGDGGWALRDVVAELVRAFSWRPKLKRRTDPLGRASSRW